MGLFDLFGSRNNKVSDNENEISNSISNDALENSNSIKPLDLQTENASQLQQQMEECNQPEAVNEDAKKSTETIIEPENANGNTSIIQATNSSSSEASIEDNSSQRDEDGYYEKNNRYVIGDVAGTYFQIPFYARKSDENAFHRNDIVADIAKIGSLQVMGASLRGESHYAHRIPRQDSFLIEECIINENHKFVIAAIADGVGNAKRADEFSEMLVNFLCQKISRKLHEYPDLDHIDWHEVTDYMWNIAVNYCYKKSGSRKLDEYFSNWASTLECIVIETKPKELSRYTAVTISGDGGIYKIKSSSKWVAIKRGKDINGKSISNLVACLPDKPTNIIVKNGILQNDEIIFFVTDGLSDYIEAYGDVRKFFREKLPCHNNLPEFIRVLNVAVKQMDDDKTGIVISYYGESDKSQS